MIKTYIKPETHTYAITIERPTLMGFSQVDNDGDGVTDQTPIIDGDPDGGIGARDGWFEDDFYNWEW